MSMVVSSSSAQVVFNGVGQGRARDKTSREPANATPAGQASPQDQLQLSPEAQAMIDKLAARDREVRAHEAAHQAAGGNLASSPSFTYQNGPDGKQYAIGGEVNIDVSPGRTAEETLAKAQRVRAAALAPAQPSGQDRTVAGQAARMEQQAMTELARQRQANLTAAYQGSSPVGGQLDVQA